MYKIAVMGGRDTVLGFRALGLDTFPVANHDDAKRVFAKLVAPEAQYAIIYLEENLSTELSAEIASISDKIWPAVILMPGRDGSQGLSLNALHEAVRRAIGADIL